LFVLIFNWYFFTI